MATFAQQVQVATNGVAEQVRARHIEAARALLNDNLASRVVRPMVIQVVDGRISAPLESVKVPGVILFRLGALEEVKIWGLDAARRLSPVRSGRYKRNWVGMVDGRAHFDGPISPDATLYLVNIVPYARKIETRGATVLKVPAGIIDRLSDRLKAKYGRSFYIRPTFVNLPFAHVLQKDVLTPRGRRRKDSLAGSQINYPAVIIKQKRSFD